MANASDGWTNGSSRLSSPPPGRPARSTVLALLAAGVLTSIVAGIWWSSEGEGREIRALPPAQRQGLYLRTMENLTTICDPAPGRSMRDFCRAQAALALEFPECDDACHRAARRNLSLPRR